ncbi:MAG: NF038122 family metalloprotease [Cyanobacteria bacterium J06621_8]
MNQTNAGVDFNFSFAPGVSDDQMLGFMIAGDIVSQHLADSYQGRNVEINIHVDVSDEYLPDNIVGASFPAIETSIRNRYSKLYDAIQDDITTEADQIAADNLLDRRAIDILVGNEVIHHNFRTQVTRANLKALGMVDGDSSELDGYIMINNFDGELWSYDYLGDPQEGTLDFLSMAQHEIFHALGFISGANHTEDTVDNSIGNRIYNMSTMDLFRYSTESAALGINNLGYGEEAFFSINGQETTLGLATGVDHQISHFVESHDPNRALMTPTIALAERLSITEDDLSVLDAIGWDVVDPGEIDMATMYSDAQGKLASAQIIDRESEVEETILNSSAYYWGRWGRDSTGGGWWQEAYFMELESTVEVTENTDPDYESTAEVAEDADNGYEFIYRMMASGVHHQPESIDIMMQEPEDDEPESTDITEQESELYESDTKNFLEVLETVVDSPQDNSWNNSPESNWWNNAPENNLVG